jgi:hypothetical protein
MRVALGYLGKRGSVRVVVIPRRSVECPIKEWYTLETKRGQLGAYPGLR